MSRRYAVFRFLCIPFVLLVALFDRKHADRDRRPELPPGPRPLKARKRALTLPLEGGAAKKERQKTFAQEQSVIFRRVPEEVRRLIWEETVGGRKIRWVYTRQVEDSVSLSLLLACRRCYSEAINILYSTNIFEIGHPAVIVYFPQLVLPQRLHAIRSLEFDWFITGSVPFYVNIQDEQRFRSYEQEWYMVWKTLASMSGLRTLRVRLNVIPAFHREWQVHEDKALQSAAMVTAPKDFELALSWVSRFHEPALNTLPCRVTKLTFPPWEISCFTNVCDWD